MKNKQTKRLISVSLIFVFFFYAFDVKADDVIIRDTAIPDTIQQRTYKFNYNQLILPVGVDNSWFFGSEMQCC